MDRMRGSERAVLVLLLMFSWETGKCLVRGTDGDDFLDLLDLQVKEIANKAVENAQDACDLVNSCKEAGSCSRGQCAPISGERRSCVLFNNNPYCGDGCDRFQVTFDRSYVRTPYAVATKDVEDSVCIQRMLDGTFQDMVNERNASTFIQYYFGSAEGVFRYFPGREIFNCSEVYDPRIRPWYTGAIAVAKDLVLLVDNGNSMNRAPYIVTPTSAFTYAVNLAQALLHSAVTNNDRVTITTFNSTHATSLSQVDVTTLDTSIQPVRDALNGVQIYGAGIALSNLTGGLESAFSTLNGTGGTDKLKIVILFTDGSSPPEQAELAPLLAKLQEQNITLFTYIVGGSTSLQNFTCSTQRTHFEALEFLSLEHPLRGLRSYLSFLARSRQRVNDNRAFWQSVYQSASGLGFVITVAYPAIYNGQLIGVAGIDVQTSGLDPQLQNSIANSLVNASRQVTRINPKGADLDCQNTQPLSCSATPPADSVCSSNDSSVAHTDLICCKNCSASNPGSSSKSKTKVIIISVVASVALLAVVVVGVFVVWPKLKSWYRTPIKGTPRPTHNDSASPTSTPTPFL